MKAMILAAGQGSRLRPITMTTPKPMIRLLEKPIMESIVEHLRAQGVDEIVVNTSHLASVIESYFGDGHQFGVKMAYSFEGEYKNGALEGRPLGSAGGMKRIQEATGFFDDTFLVLCGDALIDVDVNAALAFHRERRSLATIILKEVSPEDVSKYGIVRTDADGHVRSFQEKPRQEEAASTMANVGLYLFEPEIFDHIPAGVQYDIGGQLLPALVQIGAPVYARALPFHWIDIGSVGGYWDATRALLRDEVRGYRLPGRSAQPGVRIGLNVKVNWSRVEVVPPIYIGGGTVIGDGVRLVGPTAIGSNADIRPGVEIVECLLDNYVRVEPWARLRRTIVYGGHCIDPDGRFLNMAESDLTWLVADSRMRPADSPERDLLIEALETVGINYGSYGGAGSSTLDC